jgi:ribosomal protein S18 acetylase RimI-like enzyme
MADAIKINVRPYEARDYDAVVPMWQRGFAEMAPYAYTNASSSSIFFMSTAAIGAAAYAMGHPYFAAIATAAGALFYTPLGLSIANTLMWQAIKMQTRQSMQPSHLLDEWNKPGMSAFWVAVAAGEGNGSGAAARKGTSASKSPAAGTGSGSGDRILGCIGVKKYHTLHKERLSAVPVVEGETSVWRLSVHESARGMGVGRHLMATAEAWAAAQGCTHVSLVTGNPASQLFYQRLGYAAEGKDRARLVLFGTALPSSIATGKQVRLGLVGTVKAFMLDRRLEQRKSVMAKKL